MANLIPALRSSRKSAADISKDSGFQAIGPGSAPEATLNVKAAPGSAALLCSGSKRCWPSASDDEITPHDVPADAARALVSMAGTPRRLPEPEARRVTATTASPKSQARLESRSAVFPGVRLFPSLSKNASIG